MSVNIGFLNEFILLCFPWFQIDSEFVEVLAFRYLSCFLQRNCVGVCLIIKSSLIEGLASYLTKNM